MNRCDELSARNELCEQENSVMKFSLMKEESQHRDKMLQLENENDELRKRIVALERRLKDFTGRETKLRDQFWEERKRHEEQYAEMKNLLDKILQQGEASHKGSPRRDGRNKISNNATGSRC